MKTNLARILAVSGQSGLYLYLAQARNGVVAENIADKKRTVFDIHSRITSLADIAIYTDTEELKLSEVFKAIEKALDGAAAPDSKAPEAEIRALFDKAVPSYDGERFHLSHMRKVVLWYSLLAQYASLDFEEEEDAEGEEN